jgi:hypothetical protein
MTYENLIRDAYRIGLVLVGLTVVGIVVTVSVIHFRALGESDRTVAHMQCAVALADERDDPACAQLPAAELDSARRMAVCFKARTAAQRAGRDRDTACQLAVAPAQSARP